MPMEHTDIKNTQAVMYINKILLCTPPNSNRRPSANAVRVWYSLGAGPVALPAGAAADASPLLPAHTQAGFVCVSLAMRHERQGQWPPAMERQWQRPLSPDSSRTVTTPPGAFLLIALKSQSSSALRARGSASRPAAPRPHLPTAQPSAGRRGVPPPLPPLQRPPPPAPPPAGARPSGRCRCASAASRPWRCGRR
jgi:hypothetical protein